MTPHTSNERRLGLFLVTISAVVFSSAGIFTKGVSADAWSVMFWRGLAAALFTMGYIVLRKKLRHEIAAFNTPAFVVSVFLAAGSLAFICAFKLTSVANVALIYAAAPFIAAGLAWGGIRERPGARVLIASALAASGVIFIVSGSLGSSAIKGDLLALLMTLLMAAAIVMYRSFPEITAGLPVALSSVILLPIAWIFGTPLNVSPSEVAILIAFGLVFAVASLTLMEGAKRLPSGETALLSTLEMPMAPLLALLILSETPASTTLIGGSIIFGAVLWSQRRVGARAVPS